MKIVRTLHLVVAFMFVAIGTLHLDVHYRSLVSETLAMALDNQFDLMGMTTNTWALWQGFSFMMGVLLVIVGLLNVVFMQHLKPNQAPAMSFVLIMIALLVAVVYSGIYFFGPLQIYGGIFGIVLLLTATYLGRQKSWNSSS